jgi:hypothetical protein
MAALLTTHLPIEPVSTLSGNQEKIQHFLEAAGQTFQPGTPVQLGSGGTAGFTIAYLGDPAGGPPNPILGITALRGINLASNGAGAAPVFAGVGFPGGQGAVNDVINQPAAFSIYHGAPFVDGTTTVYMATLDTIFEIQVDASTGTTYNATTALVGTQVGITADGNGFYYADLVKATPGTNTVATIVSLNPLDFVPGSTTTQQNNGRIRIVFLSTVIQVMN